MTTQELQLWLVVERSCSAKIAGLYCSSMHHGFEGSCLVTNLTALSKYTSGLRPCLGGTAENCLPLCRGSLVAAGTGGVHSLCP